MIGYQIREGPPLFEPASRGAQEGVLRRLPADGLPAIRLVGAEHAGSAVLPVRSRRLRAQFPAVMLELYDRFKRELDTTQLVVARMMSEQGGPGAPRRLLHGRQGQMGLETRAWCGRTGRASKLTYASVG
jgi:hypothetical protein